MTLKIILPCSISSHCQDPGPANKLVPPHLLHSYIVWLQETQVGESKHTMTHFILNVLGFYSHVWYFKMCFPHLHFRKILCWQTFASPETNFKQEIIYRGKAPFSKGFLYPCWLQQTIFSLNFSFQQFHITCLTICLPSINQRGRKAAHGRNGFAPETSEGQFWLCSELCAVGFRSSMDNIVIPLKPAIKWGFFAAWTW